MAHQVQIKELVNGIEITDNLDGVIVVKLLSYNSQPFFRTTNETDEESYQVLDTLGEIYHLPALATEFVLIDLEGNYWIPDNGTELIEYSYKIRAFRPDNENDKVLSIGEIETTENSITLNVPGVGLANSVRIDGSIYSNYYPSVFNYTPIVEFIKILIIYAKPDSTVFYLAQGEESSQAVEPPYDGLFVAKITVNLSGQVVDTGNGLTLEQARLNGNILEGDVEFLGDGNDLKIYSLNGSNTNEIFFGDGLLSLRNTSELSSTSLEINSNGNINISNNVENSQGIVGNQEFNKQGDRKAFAQLSDVYDPETFIQLLNDSNSTQLTTIKGLLGIV